MYLLLDLRIVGHTLIRGFVRFKFLDVVISIVSICILPYFLMVPSGLKLYWMFERYLKHFTLGKLTIHVIRMQYHIISLIRIVVMN